MFLLAALLRAAQPFGGRGRSEVRGAVAAAGATARSRPAEATATEAAWSWPAKTTSARSRPAEAAATTAAETAGPRAAEAAASWTRTAEPTRTRRARRTILARSRLAHREVAPLERLLIEPLDDFVRHRAVGEFDERKSARTAGLAIDRHHHMGRLCDGREVGSEIRFGSAVRQVADEQTDCQGSLVKYAASS